MATLISTIISNARTSPLIEPTANFWSDAELLNHAKNGILDLWKAIIDLEEGHFVTVDESNVSMTASSNTLTGIPADTFRVELIEVRDQTSTSTALDMEFVPRDIKHPDFTGARSIGTVDPAGQTIFFAVTGAGYPVGTPTIQVAPKINAAVNLRFVYVAGIGTLTAGSNNPIPGESDHALEAWITAHALAKQRGDSQPDAEWMAVYATDKQKILTALTPRQVQEPEVAEALFEAYW